MTTASKRKEERRQAQQAATRDRYPYRHHGPSVHGSKLADYLISEANLREDCPEMFSAPSAEQTTAQRIKSAVTEGERPFVSVRGMSKIGREG